MKRLLTGFALALIVAVAAGTAHTRAAGKGIVAQASGAGHITIGGDLRTFSFTAQRDSDNNSRGQAELHNRSTDSSIHMKLNCLSVSGNVATMSGVVTGSNVTGAPFGEGNPVWFRVVDNGEGADAPPDLISLVFFFFGPPGLPCTSPLANATIPIEGGNIQVH